MRISDWSSDVCSSDLRTMEVNVRGYMVACKHVIPYMRRQGGGSIINTSSNAAAAGDSSRIAYGSSKGAILVMTKYIATQHGRENIRCNAILPDRKSTRLNSSH